jgi:hypothetical protein
MMNASYVPSCSVVMRMARVQNARTPNIAHARTRASDNSAMTRATSGGCQPLCVANA